MDEIKLDLDGIIGYEFLRLLVKKYDADMLIHEMHHEEHPDKAEMAKIKAEFQANVDHYCEFFELDSKEIENGLAEFNQWKNIKITETTVD
ncbi:hypothetical protein ACYATM_03960 [Lactobacillaceae bacterium Scapto_B20]